MGTLESKIEEVFQLTLEQENGQPAPNRCTQMKLSLKFSYSIAPKAIHAKSIIRQISLSNAASASGGAHRCKKLATCA
jgi:hypothetical protein